MKDQLAPLIIPLQELADKLVEEDAAASLILEEALVRLQNAQANQRAIFEGSRRQPLKYPPRASIEDLNYSFRYATDRILEAAKQVAPEEVVKACYAARPDRLDPIRPDDVETIRARYERGKEKVESLLDEALLLIAFDDTPRKIAKAAGEGFGYLPEID